MPDIEAWTAFANTVRQSGLNLFAASDVKVTEDGAADLKILGLMLLARTLSNLKGTLILLCEGRVVEARVLARCCYENQYWVLGLVNEGDKFRREMGARDET